MANYGDGDASYLAAGGRAGLEALVAAFYGYMSTLPQAKVILAMHKDDLTVAREKLTVFLTGWLGGPRTYATQFGPIRIPVAHRHLAIDEAERDAWLLCMQRAVDDQDQWADEFKRYFMDAIAVPAERVRQVSVARRQAP